MYIYIYIYIFKLFFTVQVCSLSTYKMLKNLIAYVQNQTTGTLHNPLVYIYITLYIYMYIHVYMHYRGTIYIHIYRIIYIYTYL